MSTLVSIVMPSFNQGIFIRESIESVLSQSYQKLELIVADGGSTDNTLEILQEIQGTDKRVRWFSEADKGPANALNKALNQIRGTIIGWLNSDDLYTPGAVERAVGILSSSHHYLMVYGQGQHINQQGKTIDLYPTLPPQTPIEQFRLGCFICQPTVFFSRAMNIMLGPLDEHLKTAFDFDYWVRAFQGFQDRIAFIDHLQASSRLHQNCITKKMRRMIALEGMQIIDKHLGWVLPNWFETYVDEYLNSAVNLQKKEANDHLQITLKDATPYLKEVTFFYLQTLIQKKLDAVY